MLDMPIFPLPAAASLCIYNHSIAANVFCVQNITYHGMKYNHVFFPSIFNLFFSVVLSCKVNSRKL